jgi:hypothetical protein
MYIGEKAGKYPLIRFRTRRPLPVQERPLEKEICMLEKGIDMGGGIPSRLVGWTEITTCLRYLRDQIEALKKNQK